MRRAIVGCRIYIMNGMKEMARWNGFRLVYQPQGDQGVVILYA